MTKEWMHNLVDEIFSYGERKKRLDKLRILYKAIHEECNRLQAFIERKRKEKPKCAICTGDMEFTDRLYNSSVCGLMYVYNCPYCERDQLIEVNQDEY